MSAPTAQAAVDRGVRGLRQAAFAAGRHHLRADQDRPGALVPGDLPGDLEQGRDLGHGAAAADGLRQLPDRLELAAQDQQGDGPAGAEPLAARVEADETYVGGPRPGKRGRGAAGKIMVAGAVESGRGQARGRRLGRLRLAVVPDASAASLEGFLAAASPARRGRHRRLVGYAGLPPRATSTSRSISAPAGATRRCGCRRSTSSSASPSAGCSAPTTARSRPSTCRPISTSTSSASTAAPPRTSATASPASSSRRSAPGPQPTAPSSPRPPPEGHGELVCRISLGRRGQRAANLHQRCQDFYLRTSKTMYYFSSYFRRATSRPIADKWA